MSRIKILSGWSLPGGSTLAHINLCNMFNKHEIPCVFYGPHPWHISKCNGAFLQSADFEPDDIIIYHYLKYKERPPFKKFVLSCHETDLFPLGDMNFGQPDFIHYVSNSQRKWHNVNYPYHIIPNIVADLDKSPLTEKRAGVIGSIDRHKNTHVSIQRALDDGYDEISLFGEATDKSYFEEKVKPYLEDAELCVIHEGHVDSKQEIYDYIDVVYHSSDRETFNLIKAECDKTGVDYRGVESADTDAEYWSEEEILGKWLEVLEISQ